MSTPAPATASPGWILILGAVVAVGPLSIDMYLPALPALRAYYGTDPAAVQLTLAAFFAGLAVGQLVYGPLADRFGRKPPLLAGLALYILASAACAFAPSIDALIALRLLQAAGACAGMVMTRAMVRDRFAVQDMARILSLLVLVMGAAPMLAPLAGSAVLMLADWRAIFLVLAAFGGLCFIAILTGVAETHPAERRLRSLSLMAALRGYRHLLTHRRFVGYALAGGAAQGGMFAYISVSAFVFIDIYALSPATFSVVFGLNAAGLIAASQVNRVLLRRLPAQHILRLAIRTYLGAALVMLLAALSGIGGVLAVALPLWVCLASLGFTFPNSIAAAMAPFGDRAGSASALLGSLQFSIAGTTSWIVGHLYDDSPVPMAAVIVACGMSALLLLRFAGRPEARPAPAGR